MTFDIKSFFSGAIIATFTLIGCASTPTFPWLYYNAQMPSECYQNGTLLGNGTSDWPDLPLTTCEPDPIPSPASSSGPQPILLKCITVKVDDFYAIKQDDLNCHSDLQAAQEALLQCQNGS